MHLHVFVLEANEQRRHPRELDGLDLRRDDAQMVDGLLKDD